MITIDRNNNINNPAAAGRPAVSRLHVVRWLSESISGGSLKPGDAAPTVGDIAAALGVARNTAAAGLLEAERRGVIERRGPGARKRYIPVAPAAAPLAASTVCVLGELGCFTDGTGAPRWSDSFLALELVPRISVSARS